MIDLLIVLAFVGYSVTVGFIARKKASRGLSDYFLAGKGLKGWQAGTSMAATQFAADTPLVTVGLIATAGIFMVWRFWVYGLAFLLMAFLFSGHWQRAGVLTDAELAEVRYSGRGVLLLRVVKAVYYGTVFNCIVLAWVLSATLVIAEVLLPWHAWLPVGFYQSLQTLFHDTLGIRLIANASTLAPEIASTNNVLSIGAVLVFVALYSTTGGLRSVVATDFVQFALAIVGSFALAWILIDKAGGIDGMIERISTLYEHDVGDDGNERADHLLGFVPPAGAMLLPFLALMSMQWIFQINADGTGYLAQRAMACRDERGARYAGVLFAWLQIFLRSLPWLLIGVALLVVYPFTAADAADPGFAATRERLFVVAVRDYMPVGLFGILLVAMLAALASTLDTHMNWGASYWSNDIYKRLVCKAWLQRDPADRELVIVARVSNVMIICLALLVMPLLDSIQQAWYVSLMFGAGVGAVLVLRWVWERINLWSEIAAMGSSLIVAPVLLILTAQGAIPAGDEGEWIRLGTVALTSTVAAILAAYIMPPTSDRQVLEFYRRVKPAGFWPRATRLAGDDPARPRRELRRELLSTAITGASLFLCLYGAGRLLIPHPDVSSLRPLASLLVGLALVPWWWRRLRRQEV